MKEGSELTPRKGSAETFPEDVISGFLAVQPLLSLSPVLLTLEFDGATPQALS